MSNKTKKTNISPNENLLAVCFILLGIMILIVIQLDSIGILGNLTRNLLNSIFGKLSIVISFFLIYIGVYKLIKQSNFSFKNFDLLKFFLFTFLIILLYGYTNIETIFSNRIISLQGLYNVISQSKEGENVGFVTYIITSFIGKIIGRTGILLLILSLFVAIIFIYYRDIVKKIYEGTKALVSNTREKTVKVKNTFEQIQYNRKLKKEKEKVLKKEKEKEEQKKELLTYRRDEESESFEAYLEPKDDFPKNTQINFENIDEITEFGEKDTNNIQYVKPPINILKSYPYNDSNDKKMAQNNSLLLENTLKDFGVNAKVENIAVGPVVTRYELSLEAGTKVSKVTGLSEDISLALAAKSIRIEAPIPGKSLIGVEVPNTEPKTVSFKSVIDFKEEINKKISFSMGKDISGKIVVTDISGMPHVLIAGSTGSGKSVCINTLICSIIYNHSPEEVKMILIDPKVVELSIYNKIPHLEIPVVTDMKKAPMALNWAVIEMEKRYKMFADIGAKDIDGYNQKSDEKINRIVIIIDELADMMMIAAKEVEDAICRIAQKARACGIHLVVATQRPSVDVITGLIKANIPTRIAFAVSSQTDSRTILDYSGAEKLLGRGDMLYKPIGLSKPIRIQGAFLSEDEVELITEFSKNHNPSFFDEEAKIKKEEEIENTGYSSEEIDDEDELLSEVIEFVMELDEISASLIQRRFKVGFNRATRILEQMEQKGIVSKNEGTKPRKVLKDLENE